MTRKAYLKAVINGVVVQSEIMVRTPRGSDLGREGVEVLFTEAVSCAMTALCKLPFHGATLADVQVRKGGR